MRAAREAALAGLLLLACASEEQLRREEVARIAEEHARAVDENQRAIEEFARSNPVPQQREYGPNGTLILHQLELDGPPGREGLRVEYTWVNTTGEVVDAVLLRFGLRTGPGAPDSTEERVLRLPLGLRLAPDSSYTSHLRLLTGGAHRSPSWQWDVSVKVLR